MFGLLFEWSLKAGFTEIVFKTSVLIVCNAYHNVSVKITNSEDINKTGVFFKSNIVRGPSQNPMV